MQLFIRQTLTASRFACMLLIGISGNVAGSAVAAEYEVEVVRTTYGIPHITAADYGSLGYGEGYAAAEDHLCNIGDAIITAYGKQALYFDLAKKIRT